MRHPVSTLWWPGRAGVRRVAAAVLALAGGGVALSGGCARVMAPPGWVPDKTPPQLISTRPEQLAVVSAWKGPVVFQFDERISENGVNDQTAIVSPDTGRVSVSRHGRQIRVLPRDGWQPGRVYHVVLLPTVRDMFGNVRTAPVEVVFSTGPAIPATAVAGLITDRLTGKSVPGALVQAVQLPVATGRDTARRDSLTYTTASDTAGFFALRFIPEGRYLIRAFDDRNKDRKLQFREANGESSAELAPQRDTLVIPDIALLPGDSTPARLTRAEPIDSLTIRLSFDDYIDPTRPQPGATALLWRLPDSTAVPVSGPLFQAQLQALRPAAPPKPDTGAAARARAAADSALARARGLAARDTTPHPIQEMMLAVRQRLEPKTRYRVTVAGLTNINGIPGGGGTTTFETAAAPSAVAADSAAAKTKPGKARAPAGRDSTRAAPRPAPADSAHPATPRDTTRTVPRPIPPRAAPPDTSHR